MNDSAANHRIELAQMSDFEAAKQLLDRANDYALAQSGSHSWTAMDHVHANLLKTIKEDRFYIIKNDEGEIVASISFDNKRRQWKKAGFEKVEALYFYKWMKNPAVVVADEPKRLLRFVAEQAKLQDKKYLRCDTIAELSELVNYYKRLGFREMGSFMYDSSKRPGVLLQADVDEVLAKLA